MMSKISIDELRSLFQFNNITTTYSDEELSELVDLKMKELSALTGIPFDDLSQTQINSNFQGKVIVLDYYPVDEIHNIIIDDTCLNSRDYRVDENNGVIYLNRIWQGFLRVEYIQSISYKTNLLINQLIGDMIVYHLNPENTGKGEVSSIKEMDTTVSYDTSTSQGKLIESRINELKSSFKCRIRWL